MAAKDELLRVALDGPAAGGARLVVADPAARLGGRGAYLCRDGEAPRAACVQEATRRNAFARALRTKVTLDREIVESESR